MEKNLEWFEDIFPGIDGLRKEVTEYYPRESKAVDIFKGQQEEPTLTLEESTERLRNQIERAGLQDRLLTEDNTPESAVGGRTIPAPPATTATTALPENLGPQEQTDTLPKTQRLDHSVTGDDPQGSGQRANEESSVKETTKPKLTRKKWYSEPVQQRSKTRSGRIIRTVQRWAGAAISGKVNLDWEPQSFDEAMHRPDSLEWSKAIENELNAHKINKSFSLVELPEKATALASEWVFKVKRSKTENGELQNKYKARLVIRGDLQPGTDLETYAPVAKLATFRLFITTVAVKDLELHQMDVKAAFLFATVKEEVYMSIPKGYDQRIPQRIRQPGLRINKALYGLRQSPRAWNSDIDDTLKELGYSASQNDGSLYFHRKDSSLILLYVDDLLIAAKTVKDISKIKEKLKAKYEMTDLNEAKTFLGVSIERDRVKHTVKLHQQLAIDALLARYEMSDCNPVKTPLRTNLSAEEGTPLTGTAIVWYQQLIGQFMYLMVCTRPDLAFTVGRLAKYNASPKEGHAEAAKRVLRYLKGSKDLGIQLGGNPVELQGFSDSDWAGDEDDRESTGGHIWFYAGGPIVWKSKKQTIVADGTWHAEYIAASEATKDLVWSKRLATDLGLRSSVIPPLYIDNSAAEQLIANPKHHNRTKHVDVRYHMVRDLYNRKELSVKRVASEDNPADILTKPLPKIKHWKHLTAIQIR
ncbi:hypothetical protein Dda_7037 [Drechslerella dactyloides]|uniref:Reverse transcriptase Ty1/copia-type domain-containing protein n=1 Tax=Drechslerella dactyloides TaxID=74499 RepID=A0AAD6ITL1_DREDA|nr:hypothetical protein Dda_7037 [Drechslerella dactyloides]